jgi:opacity protein-like surface antigen
MSMMRTRILGAVCAGLVGSCAASAAFADNPAGFYLGAGAGYSTVRSDDPAFGYPGYFNDHQTAWKVMAGVRPIPFVGAEIEYIDFGQPDMHRGYYDYNYYGTDSHPRAGILSAVGYLPLPVPFFDVYAKAGVARLDTDVTTTVVPSCASGSTCPQNLGYLVRHDETFNKFAYGVGVQSKFWNVLFRAEYQRISSTFGDPDALTVGAAWNF